MAAVWKYLYWLSASNVEALQAQLAAEGRALVMAQQNACEILLADTGCAAPGIWQIICKFDAAPWYGQSAAAGKYIVAASRPLSAQFAADLAATIEPVEFEPPALPTAQERQALVANPAFTARAPAAWWQFPTEMGAAIVAGLQKLFGSQVKDFGELHEIWSSVQANFICPAFRAGAEFGHAPYSIAPSAHISSCCVALFNMLGAREPQLVRPCIGAVIVKALEQDRYYLMRPAHHD